MTCQKQQAQAQEAAQDTLAQYPGRYLMTAEETEVFLNISHQQLYYLMGREGLPFIRIGRWLRFSPDGLKSWVKEQEARQVEEHTPREPWTRIQQSPPASKSVTQPRRSSRISKQRGNL